MKRNQKLLMTVGAALWFGAAWLAAADEPWTVYAAKQITAAPVIDGRLDDPCWQGLERTRPLTNIGGTAAPIVTTGMFCWDDKNLYIAISCGEPLLAAIMKQKADGVLGPFYESMEMFFDVAEDHFNYVQLRVDILGNHDSHIGYDLDRSMDARWRSAVAMENNQWTVEAAIPYDLLGSRQPDVKTVWGLNLTRTRSISPEGACTCWSDTKGPFHAPSNFGHLLFFPYPVYLRDRFAAAFQSIGDELEQLPRRNDTFNTDVGPRIEAMKQESVAFLKALESTPPTDGQMAAACYARGVAQLGKMEDFYNETCLHAIISRQDPGKGKR